MAITIVGKDPQKMYRCTCKNCASVLEYTLADTTKGYSTEYRYLTCPSCSARVYVPMY